MSLRLTETWGPWIEEALPLLAQTILGDEQRINYDLAMVLTEQGPAMALVIFSPGAILGSVMHSMAVIQNATQVNQEGLENVIKGLVDAIAAERTKQLGMGALGSPVGSPDTNGLGSGPLRSV